MRSERGLSRRELVALGTLLSIGIAGCADDEPDRGDGDATDDEDDQDAATDDDQEEVDEEPPAEPEEIIPEGEGPLEGPGDEEWTSEYVGFQDGWLTYLVDGYHNRIPDYSWAGYRRSEAPIPDVETVKTIEPVAGDNVGHIEAAVREVRAILDEEDREHAALELAPGEYRIAGPLSIHGSGVVVRGAGDGSDPAENSILIAYGQEESDPAPETWLYPFAVEFGSRDRHGMPAASDSPEVEITTDLVRVGERTFEVADASAFAVGDHIAIYHPCTREWLDAVDGGGTADEPAWDVDSRPIYYSRRVEAVDGDEITIDAPVYNHLDRDLAQSVIYRIDRSGLAREMGLEDLRIEMQATGNRQQEHTHRFQGIRFQGLEDGWARGCTVTNFTLFGFCAEGSERITVRDCRAAAPFSEITGGFRYNFSAQPNAQLILYEQCYAHRGRHSFTANGQSTVSGFVAKDVVVDQPVSSCEPGHHRWTQGALYDRYESIGGVPEGYSHRVHFGNRGSYGSGHGWSAVHSVAWNSDVHEESRGMLVEEPPTAQNYSIGSRGPVMSSGPFGKPQGHIEGHDEDGLWPDSLFLAQLRARHARAELGDIPADILTAAEPTVRTREVDAAFFPVDPTLSVTALHTGDGEVEIEARLENEHERDYEGVELKLILGGRGTELITEPEDPTLSADELPSGDTTSTSWTLEVNEPPEPTAIEVTIQATTIVDGSHQRSWDTSTVRMIPADPEPATFRTDFADETVDEPPGDWTPLLGRHEESWIVTDDAREGKAITLADDAGSAFQPITWDVLPDPVRNVEVLTRVKLPAVDDANRASARVYVRSDFDGEDPVGYYAELDPVANDGEGEFGVYTAPADDAVRTESGVSDDTWYWLRFQFDENEFQLRRWEDGEAEPDSWDLGWPAGDFHTGSVAFGAYSLPPGTWPVFDVVAVGVGGESPETS